MRCGAPQPPPLEHQVAARVTHPQHASSTYRYCTNFAVTGTELEPSGFAPALEELGDSVLVVGDRTTLKVHVHTDDPNAATAVFDGDGVGVPPRRGRHARAGAQRDDG